MPTDTQPHRAHSHRAYQLAYAEWFESLPKAEQHRLKELGLDKPVEEEFGPTIKEDEERQPQEIGEESHPMETIESEIQTEDAIATAFGQALAWCLKATNLPEMGRRLLAVLHVWRPTLVAGMAQTIKRQLVAEFKDQVGGDDDGNPGGTFGRVLAWTRRGTSLSQLGQRLLAVAYVLRPALISGMTLGAIGAITGKTRQAIDKLIQDFRDTFGGIKSRNMRDESNRIVCRNAQLSQS